MEPQGTNPRNQFAALGFAAIAVFLFAVFEHGLTGISGLATIDFYLGFRFVVTSALYFLLLVAMASVGEKKGRGYYFDPRAIRPILWGRALVTIWYLTALTIALAATGAQSGTYPLFLLHPLWQFGAHRLVSGKWPSMSGRMAAFALIIIGVVIYGANELRSAEITIHSPGLQVWVIAQLAALFAGAGFALSNELGARISTEGKSKCLKVPSSHDENRMSSLEVTAYTTYAGLWLMPVMLPIVMLSLNLLGLNTILSAPRVEVSASNVFLVLTIGCVIVALGTWLFAEAFRRATSSPQVAALDVLLLPVGVAFDLWSGKLSAGSAGFHWIILSMTLIMIGAGWSALGEKK